MNNELQTRVHRRHLFRTVITGTAAAAAMSTVAVKANLAEPENRSDKRKARYHANSPEVQEFYRVNRYPVQ